MAAARGHSGVTKCRANPKRNAGRRGRTPGERPGGNRQIQSVRDPRATPQPVRAATQPPGPVTKHVTWTAPAAHCQPATTAGRRSAAQAEKSPDRHKCVITADNRGIMRAGLAAPLATICCCEFPARGSIPVEQGHLERPGHPATDTYSTPAMSSRSAATWVLSARRPAAVRDIQVVRCPSWMPLRQLT